MTRALAGLLGATLLVACTPSPQQLCNTQAETICKRQYECNQDAASKFLGADEQQCVSFLEAAYKCSSKKTEADLCSGGKTFNLDSADTCNDATLRQSCDDFKAGKNADAACQKMCE